MKYPLIHSNVCCTCVSLKTLIRMSWIRCVQFSITLHRLWCARAYMLLRYSFSTRVGSMVIFSQNCLRFFTAKGCCRLTVLVVSRQPFSVRCTPSVTILNLAFSQLPRRLLDQLQISQAGDASNPPPQPGTSIIHQTRGLDSQSLIWTDLLLRIATVNRSLY